MVSWTCWSTGCGRTTPYTHAFVLVEAEETYRGKSKPLVYELNRDRFAWAAEKLRAIRLPRLGSPESTPRARAEVQRNAILLGLADARPEDVVLLLDADEVPSVTLLQQLTGEGLPAAVRLAMTRHYQRLNLLAPASTCCVDVTLSFPFARGWRAAPAWGDLDPAWYGRSGVAAPVSLFQQRTAPSPYLLRFGPLVEGTLPDAGPAPDGGGPLCTAAAKAGQGLSRGVGDGARPGPGALAAV